MLLYNSRDTFYQIIKYLDYFDLLKIKGVNREINAICFEKRFRKLFKQKRLLYKISSISNVITKTFSYHYDFSIYKGDKFNVYLLEIRLKRNVDFEYPIKSKYVKYLIYGGPDDQEIYLKKKELRAYLQPIFETANFLLQIDIEGAPTKHIKFIISDAVKYKSTFMLPEGYGIKHFKYKNRTWSGLNVLKEQVKINPILYPYLLYDKYNNTITINPNKRKNKIIKLVYLIILILFAILIVYKIVSM